MFNRSCFNARTFNGNGISAATIITATIVLGAVTALMFEEHDTDLFTFDDTITVMGSD